MKTCISQSKGKKGALVEGEVIFILLNLVFFIMLIWFVNNECRGTDMKEKIAAKEIAIFINSAEPGTLILINVRDFKDIASKNKITDFIQVKDGKVSVALSGGAFTYPYFSDYLVEGEINGDFFAISIK